MGSISLNRQEKTDSSVVPAEACLNLFLPCNPTAISLHRHVGRSHSKLLQGKRFSDRVEPALPAFPKKHPANGRIAASDGTFRNGASSSSTRTVGGRGVRIRKPPKQKR